MPRWWYFLLYCKTVGAYVPEDHTLGKIARVVYVTDTLPLYTPKEASMIMGRIHCSGQVTGHYQQHQLTHSFLVSWSAFQSPCAQRNSSCCPKCRCSSGDVIIVRSLVRFLPDGPWLRPIPPLQCQHDLGRHSPEEITSQNQTAHRRGFRDFDWPVSTSSGCPQLVQICG
jgi:hypothetical protein